MVFLTSSLNLSLTALCLSKKAKADRVVVLCPKSSGVIHRRTVPGLLPTTQELVPGEGGCSQEHNFKLPKAEILDPEQEVIMAGWFPSSTPRILGGGEDITDC